MARISGRKARLVKNSRRKADDIDESCDEVVVNDLIATMRGGQTICVVPDGRDVFILLSQCAYLDRLELVASCGSSIDEFR